jgi:hypothetical protein
MKNSRIGVARVLIGLAFLVSLLSLYQTLSHLWDPDYHLPQLADGPQHARFHFVREALGDVGKIVAVGFIVLQPARRRTSPLWWVMLILVGSYYGGFWLGYPVLGVGAPNLSAQVVHTVSTLFGLAGVLIARSAFPSVGLSAAVEHGS